MASDIAFTDSDEGKRVVDGNGNKIGMVSEVRGSTAYVNPDPGMGDTIKSKLGWGDVSAEDYALEEAHVSSVTDDEVRLDL
jgi:hypothetical protein